MAIWKLEPRGVNSPDWKASTYQGRVIVRADSETKARQIAAAAFVIGIKVKADARKLSDIPWNQPLLVSAITIQDNNYQESGNEEIVGPPEALRNAGELPRNQVN